VADRIEVTVHTTAELARIFKKHQDYIGSETLMVKGSVSDSSLSGAMVHEIDEEKFKVSLKKA
jgi:hypothetical protein